MNKGTAEQFIKLGKKGTALSACVHHDLKKKEKKEWGINKLEQRKRNYRIR